VAKTLCCHTYTYKWTIKVTWYDKTKKYLPINAFHLNKDNCACLIWVAVFLKMLCFRNATSPSSYAARS
jgi:hypothetical protein